MSPTILRMLLAGKLGERRRQPRTPIPAAYPVRLERWPRC
jgi:hypothetical protein